MRLIPLQHVHEGTELAIDILNERATPLLKKGMHLSTAHIQKLKALGVSSVYITDEYCLYTDASYTSQPANVLREVILIKQLAKKLIAGQTDIQDLMKVNLSIHQIIETLDQIKDSMRITYEPKKLLIHDFEERTIYIAIMSALLALKMGLSKSEAEDVCLATLLQDVALISPKITTLPGYSELKHPVLGHDYLQANYPIKKEILEMILHHHEKYDGTGYPHKLKGPSISLLARINAVIVAYYDIRTNYLNISNSNNLIKAFKKITPTIDPMILDTFFSNVDIYIPDTLVRLTNGDVAVVVKNTCRNPFSPTVQIISSKIFSKSTLLDLDKFPDLQIKTVIYYADSPEEESIDHE